MKRKEDSRKSIHRETPTERLNKQTFSNATFLRIECPRSLPGKKRGSEIDFYKIAWKGAGLGCLCAQVA